MYIILFTLQYAGAASSSPVMGVALQTSTQQKRVESKYAPMNRVIVCADDLYIVYCVSYKL